MRLKPDVCVTWRGGSKKRQNYMYQHLPIMLARKKQNKYVAMVGREVTECTIGSSDKRDRRVKARNGHLATPGTQEHIAKRKTA